MTAEFATIWNNSPGKWFWSGVNEPNSVSDKTVEALANDNSVVLLKQLLTCIILPLSITLTP
jgi:2-succinyl-5-enolpyruvyl-6-hydroxy-3-cyclohexene-1-carboxylate synthase